MLRLKKPGVLGVGDGQAGIAINHVAAVKSQFGLPDIAAESLNGIR